ncbi:MAG: serine hydrolase domain-containing protein, partial [Brooklawnia sp.]
ELGSITKTFTGLLLADAAARGEVALDATLDQYLPELAGTEAGTTTLAELATHTSGLPELGQPMDAKLVEQSLTGEALHIYTEGDPTTVLEQAQQVSRTGRGEWRYSNLGMTLLGLALARTAGLPDWPTLATERLLIPLGMTDTEFAPPGQPHAELMQPQLAGGRPVEAWTGGGYAPAGSSTSTTAADLTRYAQALLDGSAPGMSALEPRVSAAIMPDTQMGLAWVVTGPPGDQVAWHNGGTGGSRTMLAIDRDAQQAVIVLNNSTRDVTGTGLALLGIDAAGPPAWAQRITPAALVLVSVAFVLVLVIGSLRERNRLGLVWRAVFAGSGLLLMWLVTPWDWIPGWVFGAAVGLTVGAMLVAATRWRQLPWLPGRFAWLGVLTGLAGLALLVLLARMVVTALSIGQTI